MYLRYIYNIQSYDIIKIGKIMADNKEELITGGKADGKTPEDIAKKHKVSLNSIKDEIKVGHTIEKEHTDNKAKQLEIILDHLFEFPDYYTNKKAGLIKMEKELAKIDGVKESTNKIIKNLLREGLNKVNI